MRARACMCASTRMHACARAYRGVHIHCVKQRVYQRGNLQSHRLQPYRKNSVLLPAPLERKSEILDFHIKSWLRND